MSDAIEEATDVPIPFVGESVDLTNPVMVGAVVFALIAGATLWNMAENIGSNFANRINASLAGLTGSDVGGQSSGTTFGGD
jgi:hypothetical protein